MAGNTWMDARAWTSERTGDDRLDPAEVRDILRLRLEELVGPWGLEAHDAHNLSRQMRTHTYGPGELILPNRARADFLALIVGGQVAVYAGHHRTGRQVAVLLPGSTFGDVDQAENRPSDSTLQALSRCEIWFLPRADIEALVQEKRAKQRLGTIWRMAALGFPILLLCVLAFYLFRSPSVRQALALAPMGLGQWCSQQDRPSGNPQAYERCTETAWKAAAMLAPEDANPSLALGTHYYGQGDIVAAEQAFRRALALAPDLAEIQNNLGLIHAARGDHEQAIAAFERALELEPGTAIIEHNMGRSLQALQAYDEALAHYELAMAFGEPGPNTLVNMAIGYLETGQLGKAAHAAQESFGYGENLAPAHAVLGAIALESQQPDEALEHLQQAIALDPGYGQAYLISALAHRALDQPDEAIDVLEQALATSEDELMRADVQSLLEELYEANGQGNPQ
jgi:tetratricopeptide (TPR) repeat protein